MTKARALLSLMTAFGLHGLHQLTAQVIPIENPGFEQISRPLAVGEVTNGAGGRGVFVGTLLSFFDVPQFDNPVEVPGWRTALPPQPWTIYGGVMNPPVDSMGQPFVVGHNGTNVAMTRNVWIQQTLAVKVKPKTRYRLSFRSGAGLWEPGDGIYVAFVAALDRRTFAVPGAPNVTTLGMSNLHPPMGTAGMLLPYEFEYTTPAFLPGDLSQRYLGIAFIGSDGIPLMCYDDFHLEAMRPLERRRL